MIALLIGVATAIGFFDAAPKAADHTPASSVTVSAIRNGVQVTLVLSADRLSVTYRPQRPGFHLYSMALPAGGVDGLGVPTRLGVRGGLYATGPPTSNRPVLMLQPQGLGVLLPVYPDGPVTLTLPVARNSSTSAQIVVSYGACSTSTCLVPVTDLAIPIMLS